MLENLSFEKEKVSKQVEEKSKEVNYIVILVVFFKTIMNTIFFIKGSDKRHAREEHYRPA